MPPIYLRNLPARARRACCLVLVGAVALLPAAAPSTAAAVPYDVLADRAFAQRGDAALRLDAWRPRLSTAARRPIVVLLHGGGWRSGSRFEWARHGWPQTFASTGYVVVAPSYRLACSVPERQLDGTLPVGGELCGHTMGEQRRDVEAAIRWSVRNARMLGGDPNRLVLLGGSAGGHLALLAATRPDIARRVVGVAAISPPTDLAMIGRRDLWLRTAAEQAIRCSWQECPDRWQLHSPVTAFESAPRVASTYLYSSRRDVRVRHVDVLRLAGLLRRRGAAVTVREPIVASSACHGPWACERFAVAGARMPLRRDVLRWIGQVTRPG